MNTQTFWQELKTISNEFNIGRHPFVQRVSEGKAARSELKQFVIEHYEMTVRDSSPLFAQAYVNLERLNSEAAMMIADNFAEEALGLHTLTASH